MSIAIFKDIEIIEKSRNDNTIDDIRKEINTLYDFIDYDITKIDSDDLEESVEEERLDSNRENSRDNMKID